MKTEANQRWVARSLAAVWHPCTQMKHHERVPLVPIARGKGAWLYEHEGHRYLDAISSWWVNLFGHANDDINRALTFSRRFFANALQRELLMRPIGATVYMMPPYILSDDELLLLAHRTRETLDATLAGGAA